MPESRVKIIIAGGGTGGHVQPAIAVLEELRTHANVELTWVGSSTGYERELAREFGIEFRSIPAGKLRRYISLQTVTDATRIPVGVIRARVHIRALDPDVIFSTGGYVSVPTVIAGWLAGVPIITHEQTATVGLANRINLRFADRIALAYASTADQIAGYRDRIVVTGNPVRSGLFNGDADKGRTAFGFPDSCQVVYVTGGSLGAQAVNQTVADAVPSLIEAACVVHQSGPSSMNGDYPRLLQLRESLPTELRNRYAVRERLGTELADVYAMADVVVGRAGAGTVAELALLGKPSILIPLPGSAGDEQTLNARMLADAGAAVVIEQSELSTRRLHDQITELLLDSGRRARMSSVARQVSQPDAAGMLAQEILRTARTRPSPD